MLANFVSAWELLMGKARETAYTCRWKLQTLCRRMLAIIKPMHLQGVFCRLVKLPFGLQFSVNFWSGGSTLTQNCPLSRKAECKTTLDRCVLLSISCLTNCLCDWPSVHAVSLGQRNHLKCVCATCTCIWKKFHWDLTESVASRVSKHIF